MNNTANTPPTMTRKGCLGILKFIGIILLFFLSLFGLLLFVMSLAGAMNPLIGMIAAVICALPLWLIIVNKLVQAWKRDGAWVGGARTTAFWGGGILVMMLFGIVYGLIYNSGCDARITPGGALAGCDFSGRDLSGRDLSRANFSFANLGGAKLNSTNLSGANLTGTDLSGADLNQANLAGATLSLTNFSRATGLSEAGLAQLLKISQGELYAVTAQKEIRLEERTAILAGLKPACGRQPVPAAHVYDKTAAFRTFVILDGQGNPTSSFANLAVSNKLEPMALAYADLVVCVSDEMHEILQTCSYEKGMEITRHAFGRKITVVAARTGELIYSTTVSGLQPAECPVITSVGAITDYYGSKVPDEWVIDRLEIYLGLKSR